MGFVIQERTFDIDKFEQLWKEILKCSADKKPASQPSGDKEEEVAVETE